MAKAERRKQQLAEEEARRPRDEDGKPGGSGDRWDPGGASGLPHPSLAGLLQLSWESLGGLQIS